MYAREDLRRDAASLRYTQSSSILFEVLNESSLLLSEVEPLGPLRRRSGVLLARSKQILRETGLGVGVGGGRGCVEMGRGLISEDIRVELH